MSYAATTEQKLLLLFRKMRALPRERQELAVKALAEIAEDFYCLDETVPRAAQ